MPELPEVETIRQGLAKTIIGKKIDKFESRDLKVVQFKPEDVEGLYINSIERRAKILIFGLSNTPTPSSSPSGRGRILLCHLKMTGQLIWEACAGGTEFCLKKSRVAGGPARNASQRVAGGHPSPDWVAKLPNKYTRAIFHFDDKSVLFFNDLRRFGYLKLYGSKDLKNEKELKKIGPEPFTPEFSVEYMVKRAVKIPNRKIKQFITDQEIIAGVGNIYVDEALFYAGILPIRAVKDIKLSEWKKIKDSIVKALELGLKYGGSSEDTYVDAFGNQGTMNEHTMVYRKTGQLCQRSGCRGIVRRISLGGRGTHFCPECQK